MAHVVIVGPQALSVENLRGDLIQALATIGHRVTAMSDAATPDRVDRLRALGAEFRPFPIQRSGLSPWQDMRTLVALRRAFGELRPDVVLAYSIKPVIWGGLALAHRRGTRFFALINGLGFAFQGHGLMGKGLRSLTSTLYRLALRRAETVIFQNADDLATFVSLRIVSRHRCQVVAGSGVNCDRFTTSPFPSGSPCFLLIARLLVDKGLREYAEAARLVKRHYPDSECHLLGAEDPSPDGVPLDQVWAWHAEGAVRYIPPVADVRPFIAACHVYVLPSYHEGLPRTVMEAMAMNRPILTTDVPGCRDTVVPGENGHLVPKADAVALAERMIWFIEHRGELERMGRASRRLAEERFDVHKINAAMLALMGLARA